MTLGKEATSLVIPGGADCGPLELTVLVARGQAGGPQVVVLGGVHGDEYEGVAAAAAVWRDLDVSALRGQVSVCRWPIHRRSPPGRAPARLTAPILPARSLDPARAPATACTSLHLKTTHVG